MGSRLSTLNPFGSIRAEERPRATLEFMSTFRRAKGLLESAAPAVTPAELAALLPDVVLVDCRPEEERAVSQLGGASSPPIPLEEFERRAHELAEGGRTVVAYCTIGARSCAAVAKARKRHPALDARNLDGSLFSWAHEKRPLVDPATGQETRRIHTYSKYYARFMPDDHEAVYK